MLVAPGLHLRGTTMKRSSMMEVEAEGRTLEEALLRASQKLGVPSSRVRHEVLERRGRLLGILGSGKVKIRAWIQPEESSVVGSFLEGLFMRAGLECRVVQVRVDNDVLVLELEGDDSELLLKREAEFLEALGFLSQRILSRKTGKHQRVLLDVRGFRARREQELREKALRAAREAMRRGSAAIGPLGALDRRIVHLCLKESPGVSTRTVGQGPRRKILITKQSSAIGAGDEKTGLHENDFS